MKHIITTILLLCSIGVFAQTKVDTNQVAYKLSKYRFTGSVDTTTMITATRLYHFTTLSTPKYYVINWDSVKTVNDIKIIMKVLNIQVSDNVRNFKEIKKYLTESK